MTTMSGGYKMVTDEDGERHRVVQHHGFDGYWLRWTEKCSGCSDDREYVSSGGGAGCHECGYTGKRRTVWFRPLDEAAFEAWCAAEHAKEKAT